MALPDSTALLAELVSFDTTSRESNLALVDHVGRYLAGLGVASELVRSPDGRKANLWATIGPADRPGVVLSGHTDVVPVDGQDWSSDPFRLDARAGRLHGRGASDMKGFLASALAAVPRMQDAHLRRPVHLALSYDEEIGCIGVRGLIDALRDRPVRPALCVVGEPTGMQVIVGHKGGRSYRCAVRGAEAHSSLAPRAVNAIEHAAELIAFIARLGREMAETGPRDEAYDIVHSTISTGLIQGGTAINIVPGDCAFTFEYRTLPEDDADRIFARIEGFARDQVEPRMRAVDPQAGIGFEPVYEYPPLAIDPAHPGVALVKAAVGRNDDAKIAFGTEGGLFQRDLGIPTLVCGPGSIVQAHKPDEYVEAEQMVRCDAFLARLVERAESDAPFP